MPKTISLEPQDTGSPPYHETWWRLIDMDRRPHTVGWLAYQDDGWVVYNVHTGRETLPQTTAADAMFAAGFGDVILATPLPDHTQDQYQIQEPYVW